MQQVNGMYAGAADSQALGKCPAHFYWKAKKINANSPQCENVAYITIFVPGGEIVDCPVLERHKHEYPREWAAFEAGKEAKEIGWPIEKAPFLDVAQAATYKNLNIQTMEALASAPDTVIQSVMGGLAHRDKAKAMVKASIDAAPMLDLAQKNETLTAQVDLLQKQVNELCEEIEKSKKKGKTDAPQGEVLQQKGRGE